MHGLDVAHGDRGSRGKPNTTPAEVMASGNQSSRRGSGARVASRKSADSMAATTARPKAMKTPDICGASGVPTASRVMGNVSAKMVTPSQAQPQAFAFLRFHTVSIQAAVAASTSARARLNQSRRAPCESQCRSIEPTSA